MASSRRSEVDCRLLLFANNGDSTRGASDKVRKPAAPKKVHISEEVVERYLNDDEEQHEHGHLSITVTKARRIRTSGQLLRCRMLFPR